MSGPRSARQMDQLARETRLLGNDTETTGRQVNRTEGEMRRLEQRTRSVTTETKKARLEIGALGKAVSILKWPMLIAGAGGAVQALGGLAAGAVALVPKLLDLGGVVASGGTLMAGLGVSMGVVKLATSDLSKALTGNKNALKGLTPEGRAFVQVLRSMHPEIQRLRSTAQRGLFPGLSDLLGDVRSQAPEVRGIVRQTSRDLGGLARFLGQNIGRGNFMGDLSTLADQGSRALGSAARSGFYFSRAIEEVLLAGGPFTDWLGNSIEHLAKMTAMQAEAGRESGRLDAFFVRTRRSVQRLEDTGRHAFGGLRGVIRAARGEGDSLWKSIDQAATRWDDWANSVTGQTSMRRWFEDMRPVLSATVGFIGDLGKAIGSLTQGPEGAMMLNALRGALPELAGGVRSLTTSLGPAAIEAFGGFIHLLGDAAGNAGPLTLLARSIGLITAEMDQLIHLLGPAGPGLAATLGMFALLRKMRVFDALDTLRAKWAGVTVAAGEAATAERTAALTGVGSGPVGVLPVGAGGRAVGGAALTEAEMLAGGAVVGGLAARGLAARGGLAAGEAMTAGGVLLPAGVRSVSTAAEAGGGAGLLARTRALPGVTRAAGALGRIPGVEAAAGVAGKFFWPLMAAQGIFGALGTQGGIGARAQGAASSVSFGLVPRPVSLQERQTKGATYAGGIIDSLNNNSAIGVQRHTIDRLRQQIHLLPGSDQFDQNNGDLATANRTLQRELHRREQILTDSLRSQRQALAAESVRNAETLTDDFAHAFEIRAKDKGPVAAMDRTVESVLTKMRHMNPAGAKVLDENMLAWARQQARSNPKLLGEVHKLEDGIKSSFSRTGRHVQIVNGEILTGSTTEWKNIRLALTTQTEKAREDATSDFTAIQQQAVGSLTAMGFTPAEARKLVRDMESGGGAGKAAKYAAQNVNDPLSPGASGQRRSTAPRRALGGRLPGGGRQDTVPMSDGGWGAPHELVVNQHTEADADRLLGLFGTSLDRLVANETRPHSAPPRRATGGRVSEPHSDPTSRLSMTGGIWAGVHPGVRKAAGIIMARFPGLYVPGIGNTTGGGHVPGSYHYRGEAVDIDGPQAVMDEAARWTAKTMTGNLAEGIHNPGLSVKDGRSVSSSIWGALWAGHRDHIHIAVAGALGRMLGGAGMSLTGMASGGATSIAGLRSPASRVGGLPGMAADAAGSLYAAALTHRINRHLGGGNASIAGLGLAGGGHTVGASMFGGPGDPGTGSTGYRGDNLNAHPDSFAELNMGTALGGLPYLAPLRVTGPRGSMVLRKRDIGAGGGPVDGYPRAIDLWYSAAEKLGVNGLAPVKIEQLHRALGGRMGDVAWGGWNATGGDFMVNRPTLFGAGERGPERVSITPGGNSTATVSIAAGAVQVGGGHGVTQAAVERHVRRSLEKWAHEVTDELANGIDEHEEALIS